MINIFRETKRAVPDSLLGVKHSAQHHGHRGRHRNDEHWAAAWRSPGPDTVHNMWPVKTQLIHLFFCTRRNIPKLSVSQVSSHFTSVSSQQISLPQDEFSASNLHLSTAVPWYSLAPSDPQCSCFKALVWLILTDSVLRNTKNYRTISEFPTFPFNRLTKTIFRFIKIYLFKGGWPQWHITVSGHPEWVITAKERRLQTLGPNLVVWVLQYSSPLRATELQEALWEPWNTQGYLHKEQPNWWIVNT